ncbi:hypothetical protein [Flavobacterium cerinum]|uniref:Uncharacterized protein n=1 Tax=Flavobacterium cerinum TaxID=2502784 RepID=A0A3S3RCZ9_9FLAO|nr:hypothetical protein [Flavobacterium cerinum]RWW91738.1 hypothetical protein EPI11_18390 [Flavobacterium cerinum]
MKFSNGFNIFWIIYFLFFAIGLPLILHYAGDHHQSDFEMTNTSVSKAFILLGVGTALWFIVFIYYIKKFLVNLALKKNGTIVLNVVGLLLLIALAAGILFYAYINESRGYGWRYLYFWHPYIFIPGSFIFYSVLFFDITKSLFSKFKANP